MAAESLREELMALTGVAEAEVDEDADSPSGVRVRLEPDADARLVGVEVQRVLASHGLRSRITAQDDDPEEADDPAAPEASSVDTEPDIPPVPTIPPPPLTPPPVAPVEDPEELEEEPAAGPAPEAPPAPPATPVPGSGLASVSVEESAEGVSVTATAGDGRTVTQRAEASEDGMYSAAVAAVATLAEGEPPEVLAVMPETVDGSGVVTVVLARSDGTRVAGAAVVGVSRAYAAGRATWTALKGS